MTPIPNADEERAAKEEVLNIRADALHRRSPIQRALARIAGVLAHPFFFLGETIFHLGWVLLNVDLVPGIESWDPYPFSMLTGLASAQALFIGLLILMYAQHEANVAELREEVDLQVALHSERETSKVLRMLTEVHTALHVRSVEHDRELEIMSQPLDPDHLKRLTEEHIREAERHETE